MTNQQLLERAGAQIGTLAEAAGIRPIAMAVDLGGVGAEMLPSLLGHELLAGHAAMMRLMGKLDLFLEQIAADRSPEEQERACRQAVQLSGAAARLTERYRLGLMSLARLERWAALDPVRRSARRGPAADPADAFDDDPFDGGPDGGRRKSPARMLAEIAALERSVGAMLEKARPNGAEPNGHDTAAHAQPAPQPSAHPTKRPSAYRSGRLRHGNPSGDFLAAPRCGARTRAGCACRQPAMANGRCRLHGGKSTGARTAAGLARCRTATLVHGHRTAEIIQLKSAAAKHGRRLHTLTQAARQAMRAHVDADVGATGRSPVVPPLNSSVVRAISPERSAGDLPVAPTSAFIPSYPCSPAFAKPASAGEGRSAVNPSPATAPNPQSERPTPCPATVHADQHPAIHRLAVLFEDRTPGTRNPDRANRLRRRLAAAA